MNAAKKQMVLGWLAMHNGDIEGLARWMRDSVRVGGLKTCRAMIVEARQASAA